MSRSTLTASTAELYALLWVANAPTFTATNVDAASIRVLDHEPRDLTHPFTVTIAFGGGDANFWVLTVRIYANTARLDAKTAQAQLLLLIPAVDAKLGANGGFDPRGWTPLQWEDSLQAFVVSNEVEVGRQDI